MVTKSLNNQVALVTGASGSIGSAIAQRLAQQGAKLVIVGRNLETLKAVKERLKQECAEALYYKLDLTRDEEVRKLGFLVEKELGGIDILVNSIGVLKMARIDSASIEEFDLQFQTNVRSPYLLIKTLLPMLRSSKGQIVFINSSAGLNAKANLIQYCATKHALKAVADGLRDEVNPDGIRVLSIYPGRTASALMERVHEIEGKGYQPNKLVQPEDIADTLVNALCLPRSAEVTDICIRSMQK